MALGARATVRVDLAVTRADLLVIQVIEGHRLGHGQERLFPPVAAARLGKHGLVVWAAITTAARQRHNHPHKG